MLPSSPRATVVCNHALNFLTLPEAVPSSRFPPSLGRQASQVGRNCMASEIGKDYEDWKERSRPPNWAPGRQASRQSV